MVPLVSLAKYIMRLWTVHAFYALLFNLQLNRKAKGKYSEQL